MIAIVGAGSWGTALAVHLARGGERVTLWARSGEVVEAIRARRRNPWYLADVDLPAGIDATSDAAAALDGATLVIVAVPSEFFAATLARLGPVTAPVVSATKGFEPARHRRLSEVVSERWPATAVAVLSGPSFAREVAHAQPIGPEEHGAGNPSWAQCRGPARPAQRIAPEEHGAGNLL